jgi:hypothetical protein
MQDSYLRIALEESKQKMIDTVISHKSNITRATNEIMERLSGLKESKDRSQDSLFIKTRINEVISELSIIAGFCGTHERNRIAAMERLVAQLVVLDAFSMFSSPLEDWCIMVNGITIDFNKTPFRFAGGEFNVNLRNLQAKLKAVFKR